MAALGLFLFAPSAQADWTPARRITWTDGSSSNPAIATGPTNSIHAVWIDDTHGNREIFYRRSTDGGTTWEASYRLTSTPGESLFPVLAVDSTDNVHVVWEDDGPDDREIYYRRSPDGGGTWDPVKRLTWNSGGSLNPAISVDSDDHVHLVWRDGVSGSSQVYYRGSKDGGETWSWIKRISWLSGWSFIPALTVDPADTLHVVWYSPAAGNDEIYYRKSVDSGTTWTATKRLTWTSGDSIHPAIAADSGDNIHVVWYDNTPGNEEIYYKGSGDGGDSWGSVRRLTWQEEGQRLPSVTADSSGNVYVVWQDSRVALGEIYYAGSTDEGATWTAAIRLTWTSRYSKSPAAAASGNTVHIVWSDDTPGNFEIYYKSGN
jgi:hypothetical protein